MTKRKIVRYVPHTPPLHKSRPPTNPEHYMDAIDAALVKAHAAGFLSVATANRITDILANEFGPHILPRMLRSVSCRK